MPYSTLILTAGISALGFRNVFGARLREEDSPITFPRGQQNPIAVDMSLSAEDLYLQCLEFIGETDLADLDVKMVSAEFSMFHAVSESKNKLTPSAQIFLLHTPTIGGRLAVHVQKDVIERFFQVHVHPVELSVPFDPAIPGGLSLAAGAFIGQVSQLLKGHSVEQTAFAPIGGYKSMVALGYVAASFYGFPSLYLHEDSQVLQQIAPAPVSITPETRRSIAPLARRIGNGAEWSALSEGEKRLVSQEPAYFTRVDDLIELNELGQYLRLSDLPIRLSPSAQDEFTHDSRVIGQQLRQIRDLASANPDYPGINHDLISAPNRIRPWRLAQMGKGCRVAWQITDDALLVYKVWRDHAQYEREAPQAIQEPIPGNVGSWEMLSD